MALADLQEIVGDFNTNIAEDLDDSRLTEIGRKAVEGYKTDLESRAEWETRHDEYMRLAAQVVEHKSYPWPGAANVKYPLLTEASLQFASRAYPALVPSNSPVRGRVVGYDPTGEKQDKAVRIGRHMSWQILEQMEEWEDDMDHLLITLPIVGCHFKKTYFDPIKQRNVSETVSAKNLVVNYWTKNLKDSPRVTHRIHLTKNQIRERVLRGMWRDVDFEDTPDPETDKTQDEVTGVYPPSGDETAPRTTLEQHTFLDLDGDGYDEPYIVTTDLNSETVTRIVPRFRPEDIEANDDGEIIRIEPAEFFTKFSFVPNPDGGFYDIGFGTLLGPINDTVNTLTNQLLDAGTLSNMQSGFISKGIRLKGGSTSFRPGEWKFVNSTGDDLNKGIFPLPVREPSNVLFSLLELMVNAGQRLASTVDSMVGQNPGQNQKATTTLSVLDQGLKVFTGVIKRQHRALKEEYKKLYKLNQIFLDPVEYFAVLDPRDERPETIYRADYQANVADVVPASDPNVATEQQKLAKASGLFELMQLGTINPQVATQRILEAQEQPAIEQLMQVPPPQPDFETQLEMEKFEDESMRKWADIRLRMHEIQQNGLTAMAGAIKDIAQAEGEEKGRQLDVYRTQLDEIAKQMEELQKNAELELKEKEVNQKNAERSGTEGRVSGVEQASGNRTGNGGNSTTT